MVAVPRREFAPALACRMSPSHAANPFGGSWDRTGPLHGPQGPARNPIGAKGWICVTGAGAGANGGVLASAVPLEAGGAIPAPYKTGDMTEIVLGA